LNFGFEDEFRFWGDFLDGFMKFDLKFDKWFLTLGGFPLVDFRFPARVGLPLGSLTKLPTPSSRSRAAFLLRPSRISCEKTFLLRPRIREVAR
jgi:hypothetical protein